MINLLPKDSQQELKAAHANSILIKALIWVGAATGFLLLISAVTYLLLTNEQSNQKKIAESNASLLAPFNTALADLNKVNSDASIIKGMLSQQMSYSDVILELSALLPKNVILESLSLKSHGSEANILKVRAKTVSDISTMKAAFDKSKLFSNYTEMITNEKADNSPYPVSIDVSLTINRGVSL